jgi:acyl carrier protein
MTPTETKPVPTRTEVSTWMTSYILGALDLRPEDFSADASFDSYGLDSAELVIMAGIMEEQFGIEVEPEIMFETPTVTGVLDALVARGVLRSA